VGILVLLSYREQDVSIVLEDSAKEAFAPLPGAIGITIHTIPKNTEIETYHFILKTGQVSETSALPKEPEETAAGVRPNGAKNLPANARYYYPYSGLYSTSPDGRHMVASVEEKDYDAKNPTALVIANVKYETIISEIRYSNRAAIKGIAWRPDSSQVAILKSTARAGLWPGEFIWGLFGHPTGYITYYLDVVDLQGDIVASSHLVSDVRASWGEVVWMP
jgi:hypothetical protein